MREQPVPMQGATSSDVLLTNLRPNAEAPFHRERRSSTPATVFLVGLVALGMAGFLVVQAGRSPTCASAETMAEGHHQVIYTALEAITVVQFDCAGLVAINPITAERRVTVDFSFNGKRFSAWYAVAPSGVVSAQNPTALTIDKIADQGPTMLAALLR